MKVVIVVIVLILYHINGIEPKRRQDGTLNYEDNEETTDISIGGSRRPANTLMILLVQLGARATREMYQWLRENQKPHMTHSPNALRAVQRDDSASSSLIPASSSAVLKEAFHLYKKGDRSFYMAGDDGILHLVDPEEAVDTDSIERYFDDPTVYLLYTRFNNYIPQYLIDGDIQSVTHSNFDAAKVTIFLAHGWLGHGKNHVNKVLTRAFLNNSDANVIVLDWSKITLHSNYPTAKAATAAVGRTVGQFIRWLVENGFTLYQKIHLVGFSLGGHLVGNAGRETGSAVGRITALDPAGPLWYGDVDRVVASDAQYVEVIHTNTHFWDTFDGIGLGYIEPCGDADFYPNGGRVMPGCWLNICSHSRSYEYMASSLMHNHFMGYGCQDYNEVVHDKCVGPVNFMGGSELFKPLRGIFRVNTKKDYPY